jgi:hypothetical protein
MKTLKTGTVLLVVLLCLLGLFVAREVKEVACPNTASGLFVKCGKWFWEE